MARPTKIASAARAQRGAVLVVSMLLLLVMTVLALGASQATRMQERMSGNARDHDLAFQASEAALRAGEKFIDDPAVSSAPFVCSTAPCQVYEMGVLTGDMAYEPTSWWITNSWETPSTITGTSMAKVPPRYYIEEQEEVTDTLTVPPTGPPPSRVFYRITANGSGGTDTAQVVLQSTFARRFN